MGVRRSAIPVLTALLAIGIEKKVPTKLEGFSLLVLTSGVMMAVWDGAAGSLKGIIICIAGQFAVKHHFQQPGYLLPDRASQRVLRLQPLGPALVGHMCSTSVREDAVTPILEF